MERPYLKPSLAPMDWVLEGLALLCTISALACVFFNYDELPATIPRHFNFSGQPDGFGGKSIAYVGPLIALIIYLFMSLGTRFPSLISYPFKITAENEEQHYKNLQNMVRILKALVATMMLYLTYATVKIGLGSMQGLGAWFAPVSLTAMLGTIAYFIYKGIRVD